MISRASLETMHLKSTQSVRRIIVLFISSPRSQCETNMFYLNLVRSTCEGKMIYLFHDYSTSEGNRDMIHKQHQALVQFTLDLVQFCLIRQNWIELTLNWTELMCRVAYSSWPCKRFYLFDVISTSEGNKVLSRMLDLFKVCSTCEDNKDYLIQIHPSSEGRMITISPLGALLNNNNSYTKQ